MTERGPVLLDTSAWVEAWRRGGDPALQDDVLRLQREERAAVCHPVALELVRGARSQAEAEKIVERLSVLTELPVSDQVWSTAAGYAFLLRRRGVTVPTMDIVIASVAAVHGVPLLHRDRHYTMCREVIPFEDISPPF